MFLLLLQCALTLVSVKGIVITQEFLNQIPPVNFSIATATKSDVDFALFTKKLPDGVAASTENITHLEYDKNLGLKVLIHGYQGSWNDIWYPELKAAYLDKATQFNVIYVDWSKAAALSYPQSSSNVNAVGEYIADFLIAAQVPANNIHVVGASLGGQLVGLVGKQYARKTGKKIGRITSLDPARSGFEGVETAKRLHHEDGVLVDVIHTDSGFLGYSTPLGQVDFYPNGGKNQPGCPPVDVDSFCSHFRAVILFVETVRNPQVKAVKAKFNDNGEIEVGNPKDEIWFGDQTPINSSGVYFIATDSSFPFLK